MRVEVTAVLSLGSNLGDREATIRDAVADIARTPDVTIVAASGLIETPALKPDGVDVEAPAYLNAAVILRTTLMPEALLDAMNAIEQFHGRVRIERWGDRTLDIDIVDISGIEMSTDRLTLPHPGAALRAFVLAPWLDADPEALLTGHGRVDELLAQLPDRDVQRYRAEALL